MSKVTSAPPEYILNHLKCMHPRIRMSIQIRDIAFFRTNNYWH
jgi:hypothetical protein